MSDRKLLPSASRACMLACAALAAGCATVGQVTNLAQPDCAAEFRGGLGEILSEQGEAAETARKLADRTYSGLEGGTYGPRPFLVSSPSGTDYVFFVQKKTSACLLRLYGRQHGFVSVTNNLTYLATRPLPQCACSE